MNGLSMNDEPLKIGQAVKVKEGIEVDGFDISGWQGRINSFEGDDFVLVEWDSITMKGLPLKYILSAIRDTDEEEEEFNHFNLGVDDVEIVEERDQLKDVEKTKTNIFQKYEWQAFSDDAPEEKLVAELLPKIEEGETTWFDYLEEGFSFPFLAIIDDGRRMGMGVKVIALHEEDEIYGIIAFCKDGRKELYLPLCELSVENKKISNYVLSRAYAIWFANQ